MWIQPIDATPFPLGVLVYAMWKRADATVRPTGRSNATIIGTAVVGVLLVDAGLAWLAAYGTAYLLTLYAGDLLRQTVFASRINVFLWLWGMTALVVLFVRRRTILDLWLIVTLIAWMPNFLIGVFITSVRFSVAWYLARGYALVASFTLLTILLTHPRGDAQGHEAGPGQSESVRRHPTLSDRHASHLDRTGADSLRG